MVANTIVYCDSKRLSPCKIMYCIAHPHTALGWANFPTKYQIVNILDIVGQEVNVYIFTRGGRHTFGPHDSVGDSLREKSNLLDGGSRGSQISRMGVVKRTGPSASIYLCPLTPRPSPLGQPGCLPLGSGPEVKLQGLRLPDREPSRC